MPDPTLAIAGALLDLLDVCHKNREAETLRRAWTVVTASGGPDDATTEAFQFVATRSGIEGGPWGDDPDLEEDPDAP